jgi:hypothetical protein
VYRLEIVLRAWEDFWYLSSQYQRMSKITRSGSVLSEDGAIANFPKLRKTLLRIISSQDSREVPSFLPFNRQNSDNSHGKGLLECLPINLGSWCLHSRRLYRLDRDIQAILQATSLEGVRWQDVQMPFDSFAISLEDPVIDSEGDAYDFILVTQAFVTEHPDRPGQEGDMLEGWAILKSCDQYIPLSDSEKGRIERLIQRRDIRRAQSAVVHYLSRIDVVRGSNFQVFQKDREEFVTTTARRVFDELHISQGDQLDADFYQTVDVTVRIIIGMCLYLQTLPSGSPHQSEWKKAPQRSAIPDSKAITNEAEVCTVTSCYTLSREERVALGLEEPQNEHERGELRCHFREGHWRRPPGLGNDPTAKKTVHVRPCIVRRDRLPPNALPGGTEKSFR